METADIVGASSADDLSMASDDDQLSQSHPTGKSKAKRGGVLGKLKGIFGKKKRTRSHDPAKALAGDKNPDPNISSDVGESNAMNISVDTTFSPEDHSLPKTGMVGMKNTSASMEALVTNKIKGELERKLMNRRSLDDDGLPASPIGTPTATDILIQPSYMSHDSYRIDRDSDGSLLSIGSSENEEDAFFKSPWKAASTSAIRRRPPLSSDSESELDLDVVVKTENLSHGAAMHKRNVRPSRRTKTRRVSAAPTAMPSLAEKKTLEIAHTFLDEGKTPTVKLRAHEHSSPSPAVIRRTESSRAYPSPAQQRKSDPSVADVPMKSPKPVARSATTAASHILHKPSVVVNEEQKVQRNELLTVFQKLKPSAESNCNEAQPNSADLSQNIDKASEPALLYGENKGVESPPPPRPTKNVGFSKNQGSSATPPLQRRSKPPAIQPRPKSMFPQQRSKTQEIDGSTVSEAISSLTYSKSFNAADSDSGSRGKPSPMLRAKPTVVVTGDAGDATPDWIKLANKRKTWAVDSGSEPVEPVVTSVTTTEKYPAKPAPRQATTKQEKPDTNLNELQNKLTQAKAKSESLPRDTTLNTPPDIDTKACDNKPLLYASTGPVSPPPKALDRGPTITRRRSPHDNVMSESFGGFYADKAQSPTATEDISVAANKETIILPKPKPVAMTSPAEESKENELPISADPPWKAALKQRTGSLKAAPASDAQSTGSKVAPPPKPSWKSATVKERKAPASSSMMTTSLTVSSSNEGLEDAILDAKIKSKTIEIPARRPNPMTMSETSAFSNGSNQQEADNDDGLSFRDRLKMFNKK